MRRIAAAALAGLGLFAVTTSGQGKAPSADAVLAALKAGNAHHVAKQYQRPNQTAARQKALRPGARS